MASSFRWWVGLAMCPPAGSVRLPWSGASGGDLVATQVGSASKAMRSLEGSACDAAQSRWPSGLEPTLHVRAAPQWVCALKRRQCGTTRPRTVQ